jgi:hypothetical protein
MKELLNFLIRALATDTNLDDGICALVAGNFPLMSRINRNQFLKKCFKTWPEFSGSTVYPIEIAGFPDWNKADQYNSLSCAAFFMETGQNGLRLDTCPAKDAYREARIRLVKHIIGYIQVDLILHNEL